MKKIIISISGIVLILVLILGIILIGAKNKDLELIEVSSEEELEEIYEGKEKNKFFVNLLTVPFSMLKNISGGGRVYNDSSSDLYTRYKDSSGSRFSPDNWNTYSVDSSKIQDAESSSTSGSNSNSKHKEYSTTNIQVENVDEADITKTDGNYIYSLSEDKVIITDVQNPEDIKIVSEIYAIEDNAIPEEILLYNNKLVVIFERRSNSSSYYSNNNTLVYVYDISNKEIPKQIKNYELKQEYYTSRCIDGKLYVISTGTLEKENNKIITYYKEDEQIINPGYKGIKKLKDVQTKNLTTLSMLNLNGDENVKVNSYLMNVENAYVSENNIYLLEEKYENQSQSSDPTIFSILGWKGIFGILDDEDDYESVDSGTYTHLYKFNLLEDGSLKFDKKAGEKGTTINQFSIDEYKENLRVALYTSEGSRVVVFDKDMKKIGESQYLAKGEKMYSSRFLGDRAYLVTYKTIDPLFVIDLSNPTNPKTLGKLKIPGYSTYLHPYDENHIIGIGMQTEEKINRNSSGRVTSTSAIITGMKMALFDVTNVERPTQISDTVIGDSRTTSAILTNHKALLFSKEKEIIAIPVNNYSEDFEIEDESNDYSSIINRYTSYSKDYISEGYFVYNLNVKDGFKLKGKIIHETNKKNRYYDYYTTKSKLLRGLYIDNNLYTVSEDYIKVNDLENLTEISSLKIEEE